MANYILNIQPVGMELVKDASDSVGQLEDQLSDIVKTAKKSAGGADKAADSMNGMSGGIDEAAESAKRATGDLGAMSSIIGKISGPADKALKSFTNIKKSAGRLTSSMGASSAAMLGMSVGLAAIGVAAVLAAVKIGILAVKLTHHAFKTAAATIQSDNLRAGLTGSAEAAKALGDMISRVSQKSPQTTAEIADLSKKLWESGLRGTELEEALLEASHEAAGLGKNPAPEVLAARMQDLDVITAKFGDNMRDLFSGARTKDAASKLLGSMSRVGGLLSQSSIEGRGLRAALEGVTTPIMSGLTKLEPYAKAVFRGLVIGALDIAIAVVKAGKAIGAMIPEGAADDIDGVETAMQAAKIAAYVLAGAIGLLLVVGAALVVTTFLAMIPLILLVAVIAAAIAVVIGIGVAIGYAIGWLIDLGKAGVNAAKNLITGIVNGIKSGVGVVVDAIKGLATSAINAFKSALKIASPSKLFEDFGGDIGMGVVVGVDDTVPEVKGALETLVEVPQIPTLAAEVGTEHARSVSTGQAAVSIQGNTFIFNGVEGSEDAEQRFGDLLTRFFEGDALAMGAA